MSRKLQIKRGLLAQLPTLAQGEFGMTTDEKRLYLGTGSENIKFATLGTDGRLPSDQMTAHVHSAATAGLDGFMGAADKSKLDTVSSGANNYTHPAGHPASMITGLGNAATKSVGTGAGDVAPGNHTHTAASVGAAPANHTHSAASVGAAPASHTHTAADVKARPDNWVPTAAQVGAAPANHTHSAADVGAAPAGHTSDTAVHVSAAQKIYTCAATASGALYTLNAAGLPANRNGITVKFVSPATAPENGVVKFSDTATQYPVCFGDEGKSRVSAGAWGSGVPVVLEIAGTNAFFRGGSAAPGSYGTLPSQSGLTAKAGNAQVTLTVIRPNSAEYAGTLVVRKVGSAPAKVTDGVKIDMGVTASKTDTGLTNGTTYYYRAFAYNSKKHYQTELDTAVASAVPVSFAMPTYTGSHAVFGNIEKGSIELYTSGNLTLSTGTYDLFAVGGGGAGRAMYRQGNGTYYGGGGGGGYTVTALKKAVAQGAYAVLIGTGASAAAGGNTSIAAIGLTALGGKAADGDTGANGGSGGGGGGSNTESDSGDVYSDSGGNGGSNGANGGAATGDNRTPRGGTGQGTSTRAFSEAAGVLYAGGGGGGGGNLTVTGLGGAGGGGRGSGSGSRPVAAQPGTANTGGGGGGGGGIGGSGIAIVRWGY